MATRVEMQSLPVTQLFEHALTPPPCQLGGSQAGESGEVMQEAEARML